MMKARQAQGAFESFLPSFLPSLPLKDARLNFLVHWCTHLQFSSPTMLASVLSRRLLPRTAAALHGALPAAALAAPPAPLSPPSRPFSASSDAKIGRDALADILCKEYGLKMSESRRIMDTVFDTIVEVRCERRDQVAGRRWLVVQL